MPVPRGPGAAGAHTWLATEAPRPLAAEGAASSDRVVLPQVPLVGAALHSSCQVEVGAFKFFVSDRLPRGAGDLTR
jgi:hypothetical protein